jgi:small conductance mechanosensitive channel
MEQRLIQAFQHMINTAMAQAPYVLIGIIVFAVFVTAASLISRTIIKLGHTSRFDETLAVLLARLSQSAICFVGLLITAVIMLPNFKPGDALAGMGLASVAVGFAMKDVLQNFFAGMMMLWRKPFRIGDEIRHETFAGTVMDINVRATRVRTYEGTVAVIPNSAIYSNAFEVVTRQPQRRVELLIGIGYGASIEGAKQVIMDALSGLERVNAPVVYVADFGASSVDLKIHFWTGSANLNVLHATDDALSAIKRALDKADIEIPYPHEVLIFDTPSGSNRAA